MDGRGATVSAGHWASCGRDRTVLTAKSIRSRPSFGIQAEVEADVSFELSAIGPLRDPDDRPPRGSQSVHPIDVGRPLVLRYAVKVSLVFQSQHLLRVSQGGVQGPLGRGTVLGSVHNRFGQPSGDEPQSQIGLHRRIDIFSNEFSGGFELRSGSEVFRI